MCGKADRALALFHFTLCDPTKHSTGGVKLNSTLTSPGTARCLESYYVWLSRLPIHMFFIYGNEDLST